MSNWKGTLICVAAAVAALASGLPTRAAEVGTAFTYQGVLSDGGAEVTAACDFEFSLWDDAAAGSQVGTTVPLTIDVDDGLFTASLDFADGAFTGQARWLQIEVCCPSPCSPALITLDPRQELTPAPYALALPGLYTQDNAASPNVVGGFSGNEVSAGVIGATIGGGGTIFFGANNRVTDDWGTIGGGFDNQAGDGAGPTGDRIQATVGGGFGNTANGISSTVGGGTSNTASGDSSTVGGGAGNAASATNSTVGGGVNNMASGLGSTVPGGRGNQAGGDDSFAAGRRAKVRDAATVGDNNGDQGTFVWADSTDTDFVSTGPDQFLIRASGGVGIGTNAPDSSLHVVESTADGNGIRIEGTVDGADPNIVLSEDGGASASLRLNEAAGDRFEFRTNSLAMVITQASNVGIGTGAPDSNYQLDVQGVSGVRGYAFGSSGIGTHGFSLGDAGAGVIGVAVSGSGINYGVRGVSNSPSGFDFYASGAGTDYGSSSSIRWKRNVKAIERPLEKVSQMRGVYFDWDAEHGGTHDVGMIAEEVGKILPEIVSYEENGTDAIGMDYARLTPLLVEAIKALHENVRSLESQEGKCTTTTSLTADDSSQTAELLALQQELINTQQAQIDALRGRLEQLERGMVAFQGREGR